MPDSFSNALVLGGLAACAVGLVGIGLLVTYLRRRDDEKSREYTEVGVVSQLFVHPIKSCRGMEVSELDCVALGIKSNGVMDRSFLILDDTENFVTGRKYPSIALIAPSLSDDRQSLLVNAPGMPTLKVPLGSQDGRVINTRVWRLQVEGEDCGREAGEWLSQYLGSPGFKLVYHADKFPGKLFKDDPTWGVHWKSQERGVYQDLAQVHILGVASVDNLNSRLETPVQMRNFRPNVVVEGSPAFSEDKWKYVRIGNDILLRKTNLCGRCRQTTVDPDTGKFIENGDPLKTLKEFRMASPDDPDKSRYGGAPVFGVLLAVEKRGTVKLGDVIYAAEE